MPCNIEALEALPTFVSLRKGSLQANGGPLYSLYHVNRFEDPGYRSRTLHGHNAHKDHTEHKSTQYRNARRQIRFIMGKE